MADILDFFNPHLDFEGLSAYLDQFSFEQAAMACDRLRKKQLSVLFEAAKDKGKRTVTDLVPEDTPPGIQVIHRGRNSLPLFSRFQKRFGRFDLGHYGYNEQVFRWFSGPGWFRVIEAGNEIHLDGRDVPPRDFPGWPHTRSNSSGFSYFVFRDSFDVLRAVSSRVTVGRLFRHQRPTNTWFVLVREDVLLRSRLLEPAKEAA
jgi:hypothetical protein